jgi:hypothetical protein
VIQSDAPTHAHTQLTIVSVCFVPLDETVDFARRIIQTLCGSRLRNNETEQPKEMFAHCDDPRPSEHASCFMYVHTQVYTIIYICTAISLSKSQNWRCCKHDAVYINMQLPLFIRVASLLTAITNSKYFPESALCQGTICVSNRKSGFCCECHTCLSECASFMRFFSIRLLWHKASS